MLDGQVLIVWQRWPNGVLAAERVISKNGFFDFVGEEKGLDRPIVANFWPANGLFCWLVLFAWMWPLVVEALVDVELVVVGVGRKEGCELVDVVVIVVGMSWCGRVRMVVHADRRQRTRHVKHYDLTSI